MPSVDHELMLGFWDLLEIRFVDAFLEEGISLQKIRHAVAAARKLLKHTHPFSTKKFKTDGRSIFLEVSEQAGGKWLLDIIERQYQFWDVVWPSLYRGFEYSDVDEVARWWPMYPKRQVVIDPARAFGQPIVHKWRIPTSSLAQAFETERSVGAVARWYGVSQRAVEDAVKFETKFGA
ncbi:MAG: DUF433 domain-containing protein [Proteobacteria bacterium]|nr:DUF433 domain-containing protein [Pseudomonadota bacterium]